MDGKHHKIKGSRLFTSRRAYEYEIEIVAEPIKAFTINHISIPAQHMKNIRGNVSSFTEPVFFVEICSGNKIIARTEKQDFTGNKSDFNLSNNVYCLTETFPIIIRAYIGEKEAVERALRATVGGATGAVAGSAIGGTIGGIIGGLGTGITTFGVGAVGGAIGGVSIGASIGAAIGTFVGGGASFLIAPVDGAKEIESFRFNNFDELKTQVKPIATDILSDGQEIKLVISKGDIK